MTSLNRRMRRNLKNNSDKQAINEAVAKAAYDQAYYESFRIVTPFVVAQCLKVLKEDYGKLRNKETRLHIFAERVRDLVQKYDTVTKKDWEEMDALLEEAGYSGDIPVPEYEEGEEEGGAGK